MQTVITSEILKLRKQGMSPDEIAAKCGVTRGKVLSTYSAVARSEAAQIKKGLTTKVSSGEKKSILISGLVSKDEFVKPYDVAQQLRETIAQFGNGVIEDDNLRRHLKIGDHKWRILRSMPEFTQYQCLVCGKRIWGQKKTLVEVQEKIDLTENI